MKKWKNKDLLNCATVAKSGEAHGNRVVKDPKCWSRMTVISSIDNKNMLFIFHTRKYMARTIYISCGAQWKIKTWDSLFIN